jgi:uncharacterized protein (TIGR02594 family)
MLDKLIAMLAKLLEPKSKTPNVAPETIKTAPKQIELAKQFHGWHENDNNAELQALLGFNPATTAWCAGFVNAIEKMCGRKGTGKLNARSYLEYGTATGIPQLGDIVVYKRGNSSWQGHVGYYIDRDINGILTLGGNQGDKVCYKYYNVKDVLGYRKP